MKKIVRNAEYDVDVYPGFKQKGTVSTRNMNLNLGFRQAFYNRRGGGGGKGGERKRERSRSKSGIKKKHTKYLFGACGAERSEASLQRTPLTDFEKGLQRRTCGDQFHF